MMSDQKNTSRRAFLRRVAVFGAAGVGAGSVLAGCGSGSKSGASCSDLSGVSAEEKKKRRRYNYVSKTPHSDKRCNNCSFWKPKGAEGKCGGCQLFAGPVAPKGYCNSWAKRN